MELYVVDLAVSCVAATLAILGSLGVAFFSKGDTREKVDKIMIFSLFLVISLFGGISRYYIGQPGADRGPVFALRSITIAASVWLLCAFFWGINRLSFQQAKKNKTWMIVISSLSGVATILLLINGFAHFLFDINAENEVVFGKAFWILPALEGGLWLCGVVWAFLNRHAMTKQDLAMFVVLFVFFAAGTALDIVFPQITFFSMLGILGFLAALAVECAKRGVFFEKEKEESDRLRKDVSRVNEQLWHSQVSPHFIYNALTAIQALPNNPDATKKAIGDFARFLRQTLTTINENQLIPFDMELENVQTYLRLENIRFGEKLKVVYDIEEKNFNVPAMCVQILAENAVKHGVSVKREGGTVKISTKRKGGAIFISVEDDGVGFDVNKVLDSTHIGIQNVKKRLGALSAGGLYLFSEIGKGTTATIEIFSTSK